MEASRPYDAEFFDGHTRRSLSSARVTLAMLFEIVQPRAVIDVGCGEGAWLRAASELGASTTLGIDGGYVDRTRLLIPPERFAEGDLEANRVASIIAKAGLSQFDLAICMEVAEHLTFGRAESFVDDLSSLSDVILFSAAIPYQYGTNHINEQWPEFWAIQFRARGFLCFDWLRRRVWTHPEVDWWYAQNMLVFAREGSAAAAAQPRDSLVAGGNLSLVHPETFLVNLLSLHRTHRRKALDEERIDFHAVVSAYQQGASSSPQLQAIVRAEESGEKSRDVFPWTRTEISEPEAMIEQLQQANAEESARHKEEVSELREQSMQSLARLAQLNAQVLAQHLSDGTALRERLAASAQEMENLRASHASEIQHSHQETDRTRSQLSTAIDEARRAAEAHEQEAVRYREEIDRCRSQLAQLVERVTLVETSFAWRATLPMRIFASRFPTLAELGYRVRKIFWRAFTGSLPRPWRRRLRRPVAVELPPILESPPHRSDRPRVTYLSGEPDTPGNTYRVIRYVEAAKRAGMEARYLRMDELPAKINEIVGTDVLVIWRAAWNPSVAAAVDAVRRNNGRVIFDVDDLMFDPTLATPEIIDGIRSQKFPQELVQRHYASVREAMVAADFCTAPTESLAYQIRRSYKPAFVLLNGFDYNSLAQSRLAVRRRKLSPSDGIVRIGYAGGTRTHQRDFRNASSAIARILSEHPECRLVLFRGHDGNGLLDIDEFQDLAAVQDRIEWRKAVPLENLPEELARFDINLAPLEAGNPYCECKSELKYFEAAIVDVCTVASPTEPFRRAIRDGVNGFHANRPDEWYSVLKRLINDPVLRRRTARSAFYDALVTYGPRQRAESLRSVVAQAGGGYEGSRYFELELYRASVKRPAPPALPDAEVLHDTDQLGVAEVSVVVPLYNYARFVEEALSSVRDQSLPVLDLIVVDDCSTDGSCDIVLQWVKRNTDRFNRVVIARNRTNRGLGLTRNLAFDLAETPFVLPLDADNRLLGNCCAELLSEMQRTSLAFAYPLIRQFGDSSYTMGDRPYAPIQLVAGNYIDAMALVAKDAWAEVGGYDDTRSGWEDFDMWCRMAEAGMTGKQVGRAPLAEYRVHGSSMLRTQTDLITNKRQAVIQAERRHFWLTLVDQTQEGMAAKWCRSRARGDSD